jgi:hypothetical protein
MRAMTQGDCSSGSATLTSSTRLDKCRGLIFDQRFTCDGLTHLAGNRGHHPRQARQRLTPAQSTIERLTELKHRASEHV